MGLDTMIAFYDNAPYNHERNQDLDVLDLRLDLRRSCWRSRAWCRTGNPLVAGAHELDLPGVWRTQGRF